MTDAVSVWLRTHPDLVQRKWLNKLGNLIGPFLIITAEFVNESSCGRSHEIRLLALQHKSKEEPVPDRQI